MFDDNRRIAVGIDRIREGERGKLVAVDVLSFDLDRPAGLIPAIDGGRGGKAGLLDVGLRLGELHRLAGHAHFQFAEHEVRVGGAAGAFARQGVIGERLDAQVGEFPLETCELNSCSAFFRSRRGEERRTVFKDAAGLGGLGGNHGNRAGPCDRIPAHRPLERQRGQQFIGLGGPFAGLAFLFRTGQFHLGFVRVVEECHQGIILLVLDWIVLVSVALAALKW